MIDAGAPVVLSYKVLFGAAGSYELIGARRHNLPWLVNGIRVTFSKPISQAQATSLTGMSFPKVSGVGTAVLTWSGSQFSPQ